MSTQTDDLAAAEHPLDRACRYANGRAELATVLGVKPAAIGNWKVRGVPLEHCALIEKTCNGAVTRQELRPTDWQRIWPELAEATAEVGASHTVDQGT
jgi:DNA-binding transcriptional regulator YdaS (Cro superfamily)